MIIVRAALKHVGIPFEPVLRLGLSKAVYFAASNENAVDCLRKGHLRPQQDDGFRAEDAIRYWRDTYLSRRVSGRSDLIAEVPE